MTPCSGQPGFSQCGQRRRLVGTYEEKQRHRRFIDEAPEDESQHRHGTAEDIERSDLPCEMGITNDTATTTRGMNPIVRVIKAARPRAVAPQPRRPVVPRCPEAHVTRFGDVTPRSVSRT